MISMRGALLTWLLLGLALGACSQPETPAPTPTATSLPAEQIEQQLESFEQLHQAIQDHYVYPDFGGLDWPAEGERLRAEIEAGMSAQDFLAALEDLLAALPAGTADISEAGAAQQPRFGGSQFAEAIGAFVAFRRDPLPRLLVLAVVEGSPADRAGLSAHDAILAVDGRVVTVEQGLGIMQQLGGPAGSEVDLQVASPQAEPRQATVTLGQAESVDQVLPRWVFPGILYLLIPVAADETLLEVAIDMLQNPLDQPGDLQGIILDLRIASSSGEWPLGQMLALWGDGEMGAFVSRHGSVPIVIPGQDVAQSQSIPLAVLIGPDTNGAPELFAASMQAIGRAPLFGLPTSGNLLTFEQQPLSNGSLLTYADATFVSVNGNDFSLVGLSPDQWIQSDWDQVLPEKDPVIEQAVLWLLGG